MLQAACEVFKCNTQQKKVLLSPAKVNLHSKLDCLLCIKSMSWNWWKKLATVLETKGMPQKWGRTIFIQFGVMKVLWFALAHLEVISSSLQLVWWDCKGGIWKEEINKSMATEDSFFVREKHWTCRTNSQMLFKRNWEQFQTIDPLKFQRSFCISPFLFKASLKVQVPRTVRDSQFFLYQTNWWLLISVSVY